MLRLYLLDKSHAELCKFQTITTGLHFAGAIQMESSLRLSLGRHLYYNSVHSVPFDLVPDPRLGHLANYSQLYSSLLAVHF